MWQVLTTVVAFVLMLGIPAAYDIAVAIQGGRTISNVYRDVGHTWSPMLIYAVSVLPGHWWVNFQESLVEKAGGSEAAELFIVVWIGWGLHWAFRANPEATPLSPWESLLLVQFSVLVGAFFWTQQPVA